MLPEVQSRVRSALNLVYSTCSPPHLGVGEVWVLNGPSFQLRHRSWDSAEWRGVCIGNGPVVATVFPNMASGEWSEKERGRRHGKLR